MTQPISSADIRQRVQDGLTLHIPKHMHGGLTRYVERGVRPGDFLLAFLQGRLDDAYQRADAMNRASWAGWENFGHEYLPTECHGSVKKVLDWIDQDGLAGMKDGG